MLANRCYKLYELSYDFLLDTCTLSSTVGICSSSGVLRDCFGIIILFFFRSVYAWEEERSDPPASAENIQPGSSDSTVGQDRYNCVYCCTLCGVLYDYNNII